MRKQLFALAMIASLCMSAPLTAQAQSPAPAASTAPAKAPAHTPPVDTGKTMKGVLAKLTLSADEKAKTDKIMADATLKGAKRRDAIRAALTAANQTKFDTLWKAAHSKGKKGKGGAPAPAASSSAAPAK